eukprot:2739247-Amphidinium_carterae.1
MSAAGHMLAGLGSLKGDGKSAGTSASSGASPGTEEAIRLLAQLSLAHEGDIQALSSATHLELKVTDNGLKDELVKIRTTYQSLSETQRKKIPEGSLP